MGAIQFIENLDRTTLTISDSEFESNVEMAVFAIAERHREEVPISVRHPSSEMPASNDAEMVTHSPTLLDKSGEGSSGSPTAEKGLDNSIAMTGLLRTIQKPLTSMGRIFSDEKPTSLHSMKGNRLGDPLRVGSPPSTGLSPVVFQPPRNSQDGRRTPDGIRDTPESIHAQATKLGVDVTQVVQATSEMAQVQRLQRDEHNDVVELVYPNMNLYCADRFCSSTLANMFPGLDKELIEDVVRIKQGR